MNSFKQLFKGNHVFQIFLLSLLVFYIVFDPQLSSEFKSNLNSLPGNLLIFILLVFLFFRANFILFSAALLAYLVFLNKASSNYIPPSNPKEDILFKNVSDSIVKKFTKKHKSFDGNPITLEETTVNKMAPIGESIPPQKTVISNAVEPVISNPCNASKY